MDTQNLVSESVLVPVSEILKAIDLLHTTSEEFAQLVEEYGLGFHAQAPTSVLLGAIENVLEPMLYPYLADKPELVGQRPAKSSL